MTQPRCKRVVTRLLVSPDAAEDALVGIVNQEPNYAVIWSTMQVRPTNQPVTELPRFVASVILELKE